MLDTMTFTKVAGGLLGTFLVYLLGSWAGETLYHVGGGHGDHAAQAYVIETGGDDHGGEEEEVDFAALVAAADPASGERVFKKCGACHKVDGTDGTGPHLNGVVGRDIGSIGGFAYSDTLAGMDGNWDEDALNGFLENPKGYASGTKMAFAGLKKVDDRADVVAYLESLN